MDIFPISPLPNIRNFSRIQDSTMCCFLGNFRFFLIHILRHVRIIYNINSINFLKPCTSNSKTSYIITQMESIPTKTVPDKLVLPFCIAVPEGIIISIFTSTATFQTSSTIALYIFIWSLS